MEIRYINQDDNLLEISNIYERSWRVYMDKYEIIALSKDKWKGTIIPMIIRSDSYYDFENRPFDKNGCQISMIRKPAESEIIHTPEEYDFPDSLDQEHWENAEAYGVVSESGRIEKLLDFPLKCGNI